MGILELVPQTLFASVVDGSIFALATIGFSLTYSILKFPNIAQAAFITFGAYIAYTVSTSWKLGFEIGLAAALVVVGLLGAFSYFAIFRPLARRTPGFIAPTVASIGYGLALTYIAEQIWGRNQLFYSAVFRPFSIGAVAVNWIQLGTIAITVVLTILIHLLLSKTKFGAAMRATSSNPDLLRASGIKPVGIILFVWFLGSALAGGAGVLLAGQIGVTPAIGSNMLVSILAVAIFAGIGSYYGVIAAAFILSFAENISVPLLIILGQPVYYNIAVAYIVVILVMLYFPTGLSGSGPKLTTILRRNKSNV